MAIKGGFIMVSNSLMILVPGFLGIICFILAAFTEEPWLREKFRASYDEYALKVPRFISLRNRKVAV
jgi:protein-S-isoprenylcysteine O-methyltransferase Ste14